MYGDIFGFITYGAESSDIFDRILQYFRKEKESYKNLEMITWFDYLFLEKENVQYNCLVGGVVIGQYSNIILQSTNSFFKKCLDGSGFQLIDKPDFLFMCKNDKPIFFLHCKMLRTYFFSGKEEIVWKFISQYDLLLYFLQDFIWDNEMLESFFVKDGECIKIGKDGILVIE